MTAGINAGQVQAVWREAPSGDEVDLEIQQVLAELFPGETPKLQPLVGGNCSPIYRVEHRNGTCVLRKCFFKWTEERARQEMAYIEIGGEQGTGPRLLGKHSSGRYHLLEYCSGGTIDLPLTNWVKSVGKVLARLHAYPRELPALIQRPEGYSASFDRYHRQFETVTKSFDKLPDFLEKLDATVKRLEEEFREKCFQRRVCHLDIHRQNLLLHEGRVQLVDYGMAGIDDPFIDLANMAMYFCLNAEQEQELLQSYLGREPTEEEREHYELVRAIPYLNKVTFPLGRAMQNGLPSYLLGEVWKKAAPGYAINNFHKMADGIPLAERMPSAQHWAAYAMSALRCFYDKLPKDFV